MHQYVRPIKLPNCVGCTCLVLIPGPVNGAEDDELGGDLCCN